jgi:hypothetical protein
MSPNRSSIDKWRRRCKHSSALAQKLSVLQDVGSRPFTGPQSVVEYLQRYTHKIAISNHRLKQVNNKQVTFSYKDYKHGSVNKDMSLGTGDFIRRYVLHILPQGLVRIRHYGILRSTLKRRWLFA